MNTSPSGTVRLLTLVMIAIALVFGGCSFWDQFIHPQPGSGFRVDICVALGEYVKVKSVPDLEKALKIFSPDGSAYRIKIRTNADGTGDRQIGHLAAKCCPDKRPPHATNLYSVTVTQNYKYSPGTQSEEALKQVLAALGETH